MQISSFCAMVSYHYKFGRDTRRAKLNKKFYMCGIPLSEDFHFSDESGTAVRSFNPISINHFLAFDAANAQNYEASYDYQSRYVDDVIEFFRSHHVKYWNFFYMKDACQRLRLAALRADHAYNGKGKRMNKGQDSYIKKAAIRMEMFYKFCMEDPGTNLGRHKNLGILIPVNNLLRIYTKLEMYDECRAIIETVLPHALEEKFCMPLMVSFRFHVGRLAAFERRYDDALQHLNYAYTNCDLEYPEKVRMILIYLLPLEIILGCYIFTQIIMDKYDLPFYWPLAAAVRRGDLQEFRAITKENVSFFNKSCLGVILEDLTELVYVNVLKKVRMAEGSNIVPISAFISRLQAMAPNENFDYSEMVYLIGNLIIKNKVKGYVSYDRQLVVLCRENPFPRMTNYEYPGSYTYYY